MADCGILILTKPLDQLKGNLDSLLKTASEDVKKILYVHVATGATFQDEAQEVPVLPPTRLVLKFLLWVYNRASRVCPNVDIRVLFGNVWPDPSYNVPPQSLSQTIQVILIDDIESRSKNDSITKYIQRNFNLKHEVPVKYLWKDELSSVTQTAEQTEDEVLKTYKVVSNGGVFDRFHVGHKVILTEGGIRCTEFHGIIVADKSSTHVQVKTLYELMEPNEVRLDYVKNFMADVHPNITTEVKLVSTLPLDYPSNVGLITCSKDATSSRVGHYVIEARKKEGLPDCDLLVIDVLSDEHRNADDEEKFGSTNLRKRVLGTLIKDPKKMEPSPTRPYLIGLTGGVASGKSAVADILKKLGAGLVNCDVWKDKSTREVEEFVKAEVDKLCHKGNEVVVVATSSLFDTEWEQKMNEIWVTFIPPKEAIKRLMERDSMSEEDATRRVTSSMNNLDMVSRANVVLYPVWEPENTRKQVEKAWEELKKRLPFQTDKL